VTARTLLDASALLAFLWDEPGTDAVTAAFAQGDTGCTVANWAEVVAKVVSRGKDWSVAEAALLGQGLDILPIETVDAVIAGRLWTEHPSLSLGDRLCLAVGRRLDAVIVTADRAWVEVSPRISLIR